MGEPLCIDSPSRGLAMPKAYSGDLRERVIEAVETGASRREAAERFEVSVSSAIKWLQRWHERRSAAPKPRGGSISPLEAFATAILALVAEQPDLTLVETVAMLRKRRIKTSRTALWRFLRATQHHPQKKACKLPSGSAQTWRGRADAGCESKTCLIPLGWCLSMRRRSAQTWCGSTTGRAGDRQRSAWNMADNHLRGRFAPQQNDRTDGGRGRHDRRDVPRLYRAVLGSHAQAQRHRRDGQLPGPSWARHSGGDRESAGDTSLLAEILAR